MVLSGPTLPGGLTGTQTGVNALNERSREIFRHVVEAYVATGEPIGSRTLARRLSQALSPASVRNVMSDLEALGLLYAPHTSAGRLPTELGLRLFVDGLLEIGELSEGEQGAIRARCHAAGRSLDQMLEEASGMLSGLSHAAGLVFAPRLEAPLKHIELVSLGPDRALVILVTEGGMVENRVVELPPGLPPTILETATNYLNAHIRGRTLSDLREALKADLEADRHQLDDLVGRVVEAGLAVWSGDSHDGALILRGQANLLEDVTALEDLESIRQLFDALETKETILRFMDLTGQADGVQIFIGAESSLFNVAGLSMVVAPFRNGPQRIVGAIGVIGPTRINYARIIPLVDFTSKMIGNLLGSAGESPQETGPIAS